MKNIFYALLSLSIFIGFIIGSIVFGEWLFEKASIYILSWPISTSLTLILTVCILSVFWISRSIKKLAAALLNKEHISAKRKLYEDCLHTFILLYEDSNRVFGTRLDELGRRLLLLAEGRVIRAYNSWRQTAMEEGFLSTNAQLKLEKLIHTIRKSIAISNTEISSNDILALLKGDARLREEREYGKNGKSLIHD